MYPEFVLTPEEKKAFLVDRQGAVVGRKLADQYGWKLGDQIPLRGTIFPGHVDVHAARDLRRRRRQDRRDAVLLPLAIPERDGQGALPAARRPDRRLHRRDPRPDAGRRDFAGHRRHVQELAGRDAHRDREGVPAGLRRDDRGDPGRRAGGVVRRDRHHHGGDGQHDGDDRARALRRVRDDEGAGLRPTASSRCSSSRSRSASRWSAACWASCSRFRSRMPLPARWARCSRSSS